MSTIGPATPAPLTLGEQLVKLLYGEDALSKYQTRNERDQAYRRAQGMGMQSGFTLPIPGANPEAPTPADAVTGLALSMGGAAIPKGISRAGAPEPIQAPAAAKRPVETPGAPMSADYRSTMEGAASSVADWKPSQFPGVQIGTLGKDRVVRSGDSYAVVNENNVVTDISGARQGSPSAGRVILALKSMGATPPTPEAISPDAMQVLANPALTAALAKHFGTTPDYVNSNLVDVLTRRFSK